MIQSMTGFGDARDRPPRGDVAVAVEVKSLNNRFFKPIVRLPDELSALEPAVESLLRKRLGRGSLYLTVKLVPDDAAPETRAPQLDVPAVKRYLDQLKAGGLDATVGDVLGLPGVVSMPDDEPAVPVDDGTLREAALRAVEQAVAKLIEARRTEGESVAADLRKHLDAIGGHLELIAERADRVVDLYHDRVLNRVNELLAKANLEVAREDLLREVAVFAERSDISEEISRLSHHVEQFRDALAAPSSDGVGRKLDFVAQEMLREANTIGSKAQDADIAGRIIEIKGAIDRLKEQVQNVE